MLERFQSDPLLKTTISWKEKCNDIKLSTWKMCVSYPQKNNQSAILWMTSIYNDFKSLICLYLWIIRLMFIPYSWRQVAIWLFMWFSIGSRNYSSTKMSKLLSLVYIYFIILHTSHFEVNKTLMCALTILQMFS